MLSEDSYLLEGLQSADKTKMHPKAKLQNAPTFTGSRSHSHVCLLLVIKIITCTYQLCFYKRQSNDTNYRQNGQQSADTDYWCISVGWAYVPMMFKVCALLDVGSPRNRVVKRWVWTVYDDTRLKGCIPWCTVSGVATKSSRSNLARGVHSLRAPASADAQHRARIWSRTLDWLGRCETAAVWARAWYHATDAVARTAAKGTDRWTGRLVNIHVFVFAVGGGNEAAQIDGENDGCGCDHFCIVE